MTSFIKQNPKLIHLLAFIAGALNVLAFAPFALFPIAFISLGILVWLLWEQNPKQAFKTGYSFGLGFMGFGIFWMHISISQFGGIGLAFGVFLTLAFIAFIAMYYGLWAWLWIKYASSLSSSFRLLIALPASWVFIEWVRSWFLTGFPWLSQGYGQIDGWLAGFGPFAGVFFMSWLTLLVVGLLVWAIVQREKMLWAIAGIIVIFGLGYGLFKYDFTQSKGDPIQVSMVQANIQQSAKWRKENLLKIVKTYVGLTDDVWDKSDLIIWPETAIPAFAHHLQDSLLTPLQHRAEETNTGMILGVPIWDKESGYYYNSMLNLSNQREAYFKRHLVPFGEFMPLRDWVRPMMSWLHIPMSNFSYGNQATSLLPVGKWQAGISICYEDAFGDEAVDALPGADFLINASNDAWFGDSIAPHQHLQMARMRALETGRYMLRSTSTGITAVIDHKGRELARIPQFESTVLTHPAQVMQGATPYVVWGNGLVLILILLMGGWWLLVYRRKAINEEMR